MKNLLLIIAVGMAVSLPFTAPSFAQSGSCSAKANKFAKSLPGKNKRILKVVPKGNRCLVVVSVKAKGKPARVVRREIAR